MRHINICMCCTLVGYGTRPHLSSFLHGFFMQKQCPAERIHRRLTMLPPQMPYWPRRGSTPYELICVQGGREGKEGELSCNVVVAVPVVAVAVAVIVEKDVGKSLSSLRREEATSALIQAALGSPWRQFGRLHLQVCHPGPGLRLVAVDYPDLRAERLVLAFPPPCSRQ